MSLSGMEKAEFCAYLKETYEKNGLAPLLCGDAAEKFYRLTELMLTENEKYNLTAIKEPKKIILNHYADCAALAARLKEGETV